MIKEIQDKTQKEQIAKTVLRDLEEWFGIEKHRDDYIKKSKDLPFFAAYQGEEALGFVVLKETGKYTCEVACMGVLKKVHHQGIGHALYKAVETYAMDEGYKFIQVKTVKQGTYDCYDKTNRFYQAMGFEEFEVLNNLWDEHNPCQIYVKSLEVRR